MQDKLICLAVVPRIDKRYKAEYKLQSFHKKKDFEDFVVNLHGMIHGDEAMIILLGGSHQIVKLTKAREMKWVLDGD